MYFIKKHKILFVFCIHIIFIIVAEFILNYLDVHLEKSKLYEYEKNLLGLFISAVVVAPLVEEFAFRYFLVKSNLLLVGLSLFFNSIFVLSLSDVLLGSIYIKFSIITLNILVFISYFFFKNKKLHYFVVFVYFAVFGLIHIDNYDQKVIKDIGLSNLLLQIYPQLLLGGILSYIRIRYKFIEVIKYHSAYNFVLVMLYIVSQKN